MVQKYKKNGNLKRFWKFYLVFRRILRTFAAAFRVIAGRKSRVACYVALERYSKIIKLKY